MHASCVETTTICCLSTARSQVLGSSCTAPTPQTLFCGMLLIVGCSCQRGQNQMQAHMQARGLENRPANAGLSQAVIASQPPT